MGRPTVRDTAVSSRGGSVRVDPVWMSDVLAADGRFCQRAGRTTRGAELKGLRKCPKPGQNRTAAGLDKAADDAVWGVAG